MTLAPGRQKSPSAAATAAACTRASPVRQKEARLKAGSCASHALTKLFCCTAGPKT